MATLGVWSMGVVLPDSSYLGVAWVGEGLPDSGYMCSTVGRGRVGIQWLHE